MTGKHRNNRYPYWRPTRRLTFRQWSRLGFLIALVLASGTTMYGIVVTVVLVLQELAAR